MKKSNEKLKRLIFQNDTLSIVLEMCGFEETELPDEKILVLKPENDRFSLLRIIIKEIEDRAPETHEIVFEPKRQYVPSSSIKQR